MISSSLNLLLRVVRLLPGGYRPYPNLEEFAGLRLRHTPFSDTLDGLHLELKRKMPSLPTPPSA